MHRRLGCAGALLKLNPLFGCVEVLLGRLAGIVDLFKLRSVRLHLFQLIVGSQQRRYIAIYGLKIARLLVKHVCLLINSRFKRGGIDSVDRSQRGLGFDIFLLLGSEVGFRFVADNIPLLNQNVGGCFGGLDGSHSLLVKCRPLLADLTDLLGFGGQRGVLEFLGHAIHLGQVGHQIGHFLLGALVGLFICLDDVVFLLKDALEGRPLDAGAVLHRWQGVLAEGGNLGIHIAKHNEGGNPKHRRNRGNGAES